MFLPLAKLMPNFGRAKLCGNPPASKPPPVHGCSASLRLRRSSELDPSTAKGSGLVNPNGDHISEAPAFKLDILSHVIEKLWPSCQVNEPQIAEAVQGHCCIDHVRAGVVHFNVCHFHAHGLHKEVRSGTAAANTVAADDARRQKVSRRTSIGVLPPTSSNGPRL